jgi:hypothetical protein
MEEHSIVPQPSPDFGAQGELLNDAEALFETKDK